MIDNMPDVDFLRRGFTDFYANVWIDTKSIARTHVVGQAHPTRSNAKIAAVRQHPESWRVAYRLRIRFKAGVCS